MNQSNSSKLRIAVTGSNGYLGSRLCDYFAGRNYTVYQLTSSENAKEKQVRFTLLDGAAKNFFKDEKIDTLVHVAYDLKQIKRPDIWRVNVEGSIKLFEQAASEGVQRIVFISTASAYSGCRSLYGLAKLEIEDALRPMNIGISIRPGLIYSTPLNNSGGIVGNMVGKLQKTSVMPLIGSGEYKLTLAHEQDLIKLIDYYAQPEVELPPEGYIIAANPRQYSFRSILENLAKATRTDGKITLLPVPWRGVWLGIKTAETVGLKLGFRSDSILGLIHQDKEPNFSIPLPEGVSFRDFSSINEDASVKSKR